MSENFLSIRNILIRYWDPIGVKDFDDFDESTDSEYDGYAEHIHAQLKAGRDFADVRNYLMWAERNMGVDVQPERAEEVTRKIFSLR